MKDTAYLIITKQGIRKLTKGQPGLKNDELAIRLTVNVPNKAFDRFIPSAQLTIAEENIIAPDISVTAEPTTAQVVKSVEAQIEQGVDRGVDG